MSGAADGVVRVAYLLLVHAHPGQVVRLIDRLAVPWARFFVHVDRKVDDAAFRRALCGRPEVHFLKNRQAIFWGGFRIVKATLDLLEAAFLHPARFTHFILLSGSDYPIKPNPLIAERLRASPQNFLHIERTLSTETRRNAVNSYHFKDIRWLNHTAPPRGPTDKILRWACHRTVWALGYSNRTRPLPAAFTFYKGSQWWCLRRDAVAYVLDFTKTEPAILAFHKYAHAPDEIYIQSVIKNSPLAATISHDWSASGAPASATERGVHYITPTPGSHPRALIDDDFDRLRQSPALFARKFDAIRSTMLMDRIDQEILGIQQAREALPPSLPR